MALASRLTSRKTETSSSGKTSSSSKSGSRKETSVGRSVGGGDGGKDDNKHHDDDNDLVTANEQRHQRQLHAKKVRFTIVFFHVIITVFFLSFVALKEPSSTTLTSSDGNPSRSGRIVKPSSSSGTSTSSVNMNNDGLNSVSNGSPQTSSSDSLYPFYKEVPSPKQIMMLIPIEFPTVPHLENCTLQHRPPPPRTDESTWRKPLWAPSYPGSGGSTPNKLNGGGDLIKAIVERLTSRQDDSKINPVKNYHMSIKNKLKRCKGVSETVLCTQGHPIVPVEPHKQTANFQPSVILPIRNIATAFPNSLNDKAVAYHNSGGGQIQREDWISTRDTYLNGTVMSWIDVVQHWLGITSTSDGSTVGKEKNTYYHVGLFVPWEDLMDLSTLFSLSKSMTPQQVEEIIQSGRGPQLVHSIALTLVSAGYNDGTITESLDDATCIWYQVVKKEWTRQQTDMTMTYLPRYKEEQIDYMIDKMQQLMREQQQRQSQQQDDHSPSLIPILKRYITQLQHLKE